MTTYLIYTGLILLALLIAEPIIAFIRFDRYLSKVWDELERYALPCSAETVIKNSKREIIHCFKKNVPVNDAAAKLARRIPRLYRVKK